MANTTTITGSFHRAYRLLKLDEAQRIRERIMEVCDWSEVTFYRKLKDQEAISEAEKWAISEIFGQPQDQLFAA